MKFAKISLSLVLFAGLGSLFLVPTTAQGRDNTTQPGPAAYHVHYDVLYRHSHHEPWQFHGRYETYHSAQHAAHDLEHQGHETSIRHVQL